MTQEEIIKFLKENEIDVSQMSYNLINDIKVIADKIAEECVKNCLLIMCKSTCLTKKGGVE